jgi:hypothetical protein
MRSASFTTRLGLFAGLALAIAAAPRTGAASARRVARAKAFEVSFAPLFDATARFQVRQAVKLRFRASAAGRLPTPADVSISLRRGPSGGEMRLPVRELKGGVFEVPFAPMWPGEYLLAIEVRGAPRRPVAQVSLGVVGVAPGLIEVPPEQDAEVLQQRRGASRTAR